MARPTNEERERRAREQQQPSAGMDAPSMIEAGPDQSPFQATVQQGQDHWDRLNEIDERAPDRRPATPVNVLIDPMETAPDERKPAGDLGRALNQMAGRAAITENDNPRPQTRPIPPTTDLYGRGAGEGTEVQLTRGYQVKAEEPKRQAGEVVRMEDREARRLVNLGAARFTDV